MAVSVLARDFEVVYVNPALCEITAIPQAAMIGMKLRNHKTYDDDDLPKVFEHMDRVVNQGMPERIETWAVREDGSRRLMLWSSMPLCGPDGEFQFLLSVGMDVTEQRTFLGETTQNSHDLVRQADTAMYRAKQCGKGCFAFADPASEM